MIFRILVVLLLSLAVAAIAAVLFGNRRWHRDSAALIARMASTPTPGSTWSESDLAALPAPVAKYFRHVLTPGQRRVTRLTVEQTGSFLMKPGPSGWRPFRARQEFRVQPPAFLWDARIAMGPGLPVHVRDSYIAGRGAMLAQLLALFPLVDVQGSPEMAQGSLQRHLAEAMWMPTALLPGQGVTWATRDDTSAVATLTDGAVSVSLEFHFDAAGDIRRVYTPARMREVNGRFEAMPWGGENHRFETHDGMRIPVETEVLWWVNGERLPYWRGTVTRAQYQFAP